MKKIFKYLLMFLSGGKALSEAVNSAQDAEELDKIVLGR